MESLLDVLIIGGGPGGLSVATGLARQLYTTVVFDSGIYRNERAEYMHNVPTWDHRNPADFRSKARSDLLARYELISFESTTIATIQKRSDGHFEAIDSSGKTWTGKKVVLAIGQKDIYPDIRGYESAWGRGTFHCLFCHGFEERGSASVGVLVIGDIANPQFAIRMAHMAKRLAKSVVVYTDGNAELQETIQAAAQGGTAISTDSRKNESLEKTTQDQSEIKVHFADGSSATQGFLVHKPKSKVNGPFVQQLSLETCEPGYIKTEPFSYETSMKGVFAIGDCAAPAPAVPIAVAMGTYAASALSGQLGAEEI